MNRMHLARAALASTVLFACLVAPSSLRAKDDEPGSARKQPATTRSGSLSKTPATRGLRSGAAGTGRRTPKQIPPSAKGKTSPRKESPRRSLLKKSDSLRKPASFRPVESGEKNGKTEAGATEAGETEAGKTGTEADGSWIGAVVAFFVDNQVWVFSGLGVVVLFVVGWKFLGPRVRRRSGDPFLEPLDDEIERGLSGSPAARPGRFSSTRLRAADVNARLSGSGVLTEEVETDREYAFVIDEEDLKQKEIDAHTGRVYADESGLQECLSSQDLDGAWEAYTSVIERDGTAEFRVEVEKELSEQLLRTQDYARAARVLERHVAMHATEDVDPDSYFNLGYIHFQTKTVNKSRRFFKLFIENDRRPAFVARARRILDTLEEGPSQN